MNARNDFFECCVCAEQKALEDELGRDDDGDLICKKCDDKLEHEAEQHLADLQSMYRRSVI